MAALFFSPSGMQYDPNTPSSFSNDRFVLSKGHAAPILYAAWAEAGYIDKKELLNLRKIDCELEGHPTGKLDFVDIATGSLGQGLSGACGLAYSMKYLEKQRGTHVFVLCGDGEMAEGSNWEALAFAAHYKLDNLVAIVDVNRLGQSEATSLEHKVSVYKKRFEAFGCHALDVDGHNIVAIEKALDKARKAKNAPVAIIAKTFKGRGFGEKIEDKDNFHGKPLGGDAEAVLKELRSTLSSENGEAPVPAAPAEESKAPPEGHHSLPKLTYELGKRVATRTAYGRALRSLGEASELIVGLDADTKNSTMAIDLLKERPQQFIECFIAEQNMVGVALGVSARARVPFVSTFAAFLMRAADFARMCPLSQGNVKLVGSHAGVSIGADGPSQMGLEDLAFFRTLPGATVLYPSDAVSMERAVELAANTRGMVYIRSTRAETEVIYGCEEEFAVGQAKVVQRSKGAKATIVAAGVTLEEARKAAKKLEAQGIGVTVVDLFCVKPVDAETLEKCARESNDTILTVEDHYPEGGIFEAVCGAMAGKGIAVHKLAVGGLPRSGQPKELLAMFEIDDNAIVAKVNEILE